jgi:hypothetical protein
VEAVSAAPFWDDPLPDEREEQRALMYDDDRGDYDDRPTAAELADEESAPAAAWPTSEDDILAFVPGFEVTADQVTYVGERALVPMPERDVHWFHVRIRGERPGWAYVDRAQPRPEPADIARWLMDAQTRLGAGVVEGRMLGGGMELHPPSEERG